MQTGAFRYLFRQEFRTGPWAWSSRSRFWMWFYLGLIALTMAVVGTFVRAFDPVYIAYSLFGLPYVAAMLMFGTMAREWRRGTAEWWLTLPYSRTRLLGAKCVASLVRLAAIVVALFIGVLILALYITAIRHTGLTPIWHLLHVYAVIAVLISGVGPMMVGLGALIGIVGRSPAKPLQGLLWVVFGLSGNIMGWTTHVYTANKPVQPWLISIPTWGMWAIPTMWVLALGLFFASVTILDKYLEV